MKQKRAVQDAGSTAGPRAVLVEDVMTTSVATVTRHQSVGHVRALLSKRGIHSTPVVNAEGEAVGVITSTDLIGSVADETLVGRVMTSKVYTVPKYSGVHVAARIMRNHRIHHVIVTHEKKVVGLLSSFDLLRLVEDHRFAEKNPPSRSKKGGKRKREEET